MNLETLFAGRDLQSAEVFLPRRLGLGCRPALTPFAWKRGGLIGDFERPAINQQLLDHHRRRNRIGSNGGRINYRDSPGGRDPDASIGRLAGPRLEAPRTNLGSQPLGFTVAQTVEGLCSAVGATVQLGLAGPQDAAMGTYPQIAFAVIHQMAN